MDHLSEVRHVTRDSSDPDNPTTEEIVQLLEDVRHIAVIGLSRRPGKAARRVPSYLAAKGYDVIPVNPHATRLLGRRSYPALDEVPEPVDLVLVFRPSSEAGPFVTAAAARSGLPGIWLQTGIRADDEANAARELGRTVVQDLCIFRVHRALDL